VISAVTLVFAVLFLLNVKIRFRDAAGPRLP